MKKTHGAVAVGAIAAVVAVFGVGYGVAAAQDDLRDGGQRAPEFSQMQQLHERDPQMRRMHNQMMRDPEMRRMHNQMMRMHQMMGDRMGMPKRGSSEMGGEGHMGG